MAPDDTTPAEDRAAAPRRGRKRDLSRDAVILDAALDVLAEVGFEGMTMDMVVARAKAGKATVYRRWSSKPELVRDAVARLSGEELTLDQLPDTGSLRGDLVALLQPRATEEQERKLKVMAGLTTVTLNDPELGRAVAQAVVGPWVQVNRLLMARAVERGQLPPATPVDLLAHVLPSMVSFRSMIERRPIDDDGAYILTLIDSVLLPAIHGSPGPRAG